MLDEQYSHINLTSIKIDFERRDVGCHKTEICKVIIYFGITWAILLVSVPILCCGVKLYFFFTKNNV